MTINSVLLSLLACPLCRGSLEATPPDEGSGAKTVEGLICQKCGVVYPVRDEIPVMLAEEAVSVREWAQGKRMAGVSGKPS